MGIPLRYTLRTHKKTALIPKGMYQHCFFSNKEHLSGDKIISFWGIKPTILSNHIINKLIFLCKPKKRPDFSGLSYKLPCIHYHALPYTPVIIYIIPDCLFSSYMLPVLSVPPSPDHPPSTGASSLILPENRILLSSLIVCMVYRKNDTFHSSG